MVNRKKKVKILSGYRVTIPKELRERFNLSVGQELEVEARGGEIVFRVSKKDPVFMILGIARGAEKKTGDELFVEELEKKGERS